MKDTCAGIIDLWTVAVIIKNTTGSLHKTDGDMIQSRAKRRDVLLC